MSRRRPKRARGETPRSINAKYRVVGERFEPKPVRSPLAAPVLTYQGRGQWRLEEHYAAKIPQPLIIPAGFVFDLASIPKAFWWLIAPFELGIVAPLVHDFLYRNGGFGEVTRADADAIFRTLMIAEHIELWRVAATYRAVRLFSGGSWRD